MCGWRGRRTITFSAACSSPCTAATVCRGPPRPYREHLVWNLDGLWREEPPEGPSDPRGESSVLWRCAGATAGSTSGRKTRNLGLSSSTMRMRALIGAFPESDGDGAIGSPLPMVTHIITSGGEDRASSRAYWLASQRSAPMLCRNSLTSRGEPCASGRLQKSELRRRRSHVLFTPTDVSCLNHDKH